MGEVLERPIVVLVDHLDEAEGGGLAPASAQLLTLARSLTTGGVVAVAPVDSPDLAALGEQGAARVLAPDLAGRSPRVPAVLADAVEGAVAEVEDPAAVLVASDYRGREVAAVLAVRLGGGAVVDAAGVKAEGGALEVRKSAFAGTWATRVRLTGRVPVIAVRPSSVEARPAAEPSSPEVVRVAVGSSPESLGVELVSSTRQESTGGVALADARVVVVGGRGTGGDFGPVRALADVLGGAVGATRVACDEGWAPRALQIGQTGVSVAPRIYIGLGVSGAIHHTVGMQAARRIVAVDDDPDAPIFDIADFGVVGDLFEVVPQALETLRKELGGQ